MADVPKGLGNIPELLARYQKAEALWNLWRSTLQEGFEVAAPNRETFTDHSAGQRKGRRIFDYTAVNGLPKFANRVESASFPAWQQWMKFEAGSEVPEEEVDKTNEELETTTDVFFSHLNHSNFTTEIAQALID